MGPRSCPHCGVKLEWDTTLELWAHEGNNCIQAHTCIAEEGVELWNIRATDATIKELVEAFDAACAFIDSHVCDYDITAEMCRAYEKFNRLRGQLQYKGKP